MTNLPTHPLKTHQTGFTFIELMVVITLMVMLMVTVASMFFTTLIGTGKTNSSFQVKEEGDFALGQMEFLLRNAIAVDSTTCQPGGSSITFTNYDNGITTLGTFDDQGHQKIASISASSPLNPALLTSERVELTTGPTFNCSQNPDGSGTFVEIDFTLRKGTPGLDQPRDIVEESFGSGVVIRNLY